jgi:hypothetical protein
MVAVSCRRFESPHPGHLAIELPPEKRRGPLALARRGAFWLLESKWAGRLADGR